MPAPMLKSFRLDAKLAIRLEAVSRLTGKPDSALIREAVAAHCDAILAGPLRQRLADVIGQHEGRAPVARRSEAAFTEALGAAGRRPRPRKRR